VRWRRHTERLLHLDRVNPGGFGRRYRGCGLAQGGAPAATGLGETLALFEHHLPASEMPVLVADELWEVLPADPRRLRLIRGDEETA